MDIASVLGSQPQTGGIVPQSGLAQATETLNQETLDKDDFLQILITQLTNQDPIEPMQDREFVAQMAQFSTLEQMTNMSSEFQELSGLLSSGQAIGLLGRSVEISRGSNTVSGIVSEVTAGLAPQVLVNDQYYDFRDVARVIRAEEE
jgi:flagellar basal-body rod modification protein FlgD